MQSFLVALGTCSVTMSIAALLFLMLSPVLSKKYSPKWQYYAWLIIVAGLIIPFRPDFGFTVFKIDIPDSSLAAQQYEQMSDAPDGQYVPAPAVNPDDVTATGPNDAPEDTAQMYQPDLPEDIVPESVETMEATPFMPQISVYQIIGLIWLIGVVFMIICNSIKHYRFTTMLNRWSEPVTDEEALNVLHDITKEMAIFDTVKLKVCPLVKSPLMIGFINPTIIVHTIDIPKDELAFILMHELTHYKRKDLWYKSLVLTATIIHWFNPVVHLISKEIDLQCEISCDWEVIHNADGKSKQQYSETIIGVIRQQSKLKTVLSTSFYGGKRGVKKRIFSIMNTATKKVGLTVVGLAVILTMGTGMSFSANVVAPSDDPSRENGFGGDILPNVPTREGTSPAEEQTNIAPDDGAPPAPQPLTIKVDTFDPIDIGGDATMLLGLFANNDDAVEYGFYWGTTNDPATKIIKGTSSEDVLSFTHEFTGLRPDTKYYCRAYAGPVTGEVMSFRPPAATARPQSISVLTLPATDINSNTMTLLGLFANNGGAVEYGFYWGTESNPEYQVLVGMNSAADLSFTYNLTALRPDTTYYCRAYAGTVMGEIASFKTPEAAPSPTPASEATPTPAPVPTTTPSAVTAATITVANIQSGAAVLNGSFANNSGTVEYGFYWGTESSPEYQVSIGTSSAEAHSFSYDLTALRPDTTFYFKAYAGESEGAVRSFKTPPAGVFTVSTSAASNIKSSSAALNGSFTNNSETVEYGFYWGTTVIPETKAVIGTSSVTAFSFTYDLTGLAPNTTYYFRAYAGTFIDEALSFRTTATGSLTASTSEASALMSSTATLNGSFTNNSRTAEYGFYWGTTNRPITKVEMGTSSEATLSFSHDLTGLTPNTTYYFRSYAGTSEGAVQSFKTTTAGALTASTYEASALRSNSAALNGSFANNGEIVEYGFYWGTTSRPETKAVMGTSSKATISFTHDLTGLTPNTTYYFKAYAGTRMGEILKFKTPAASVTASTSAASEVEYDLTKLNGSFANNNGTVAYGFYWGATNRPTANVVKGTSSAAALNFSHDLTGLEPDTTYYFKAYAGESQGEVLSFKTPAVSA